MIVSIFANINKIITNDSKTTTYKFALLRGTIDIITDNSPFINIQENIVTIPTGLMIEKWLLYYYPIIEAGYQNAQIHGADAKLAICDKFLPIIEYYKIRGGISAFYNDLRNKGLSDEIVTEFTNLAKDLKNTITKMPMQYIGK